MYATQALGGGAITLHDIEEVTDFSLELLMSPSPFLTFKDGLITITAANGQWTWKEITRRHEGFGDQPRVIVVGELISERVTP